jgi:hypothetical protein
VARLPTTLDAILPYHGALRTKSLAIAVVSYNVLGGGLFSPLAPTDSLIRAQHLKDRTISIGCASPIPLPLLVLRDPRRSE